jgi:thioredoxin-like negative regulator of GroEL
MSQAWDSQQLTSEDLESRLAGQSHIVLHFSSPPCGVCHVTLPRVEALANDYGWPVIDISIAKHPAVAGQRLVFTVPTVLVLLEGREILRESRFIDFDRLARILELALPGEQAAFPG